VERALDADVRTFGSKKLGFFEIYGVSARTVGPIFTILCVRLLWTALKGNSELHKKLRRLIFLQDHKFKNIKSNLYYTRLKAGCIAFQCWL